MNFSVLIKNLLKKTGGGGRDLWKRYVAFSGGGTLGFNKNERNWTEELGGKPDR